MARQFVYKIGGSGTLLTQEEIDNNILCIFNELSYHGFSKKAIAGACGCFHEESGFNPGIYETRHQSDLSTLPYFKGGMGLAQWTDYPAYSGTYPNPLPWSAEQESRNWYDGAFQCWLLTKADDNEYTSMGYGQGPRWGWQRGSYPYIPYGVYKVFDGDVAEAVIYWFFCMEWHSPSVPPEVSLEERIRWGQYAYDLIEGRDPEPPEPIPPTPTGKKKGMPVWMMLRRPI